MARLLLVLVNFCALSRHASAVIRVWEPLPPSSTTSNETFADVFANYTNLDLRDGPIKVQLGVYVNTIYSVDERNMDYSVNMLLRLIWTDYRLARRSVMNGTKEPVSEPTKVLESFGHTMEGLELEWLPQGAVEFDKNLEMAQYGLVGHDTRNCTMAYKTGYYPCLEVIIIIKRNVSYYILQIYLPATLVVILSWVGFWISSDSVPARVSLSLLTVLTMTTQKMSANSSLPPVSYVKAMDIWMTVSLVFVFLSLIEFAIVNVVSRGGLKQTFKTKQRNRRKKKKATHPAPVVIDYDNETGLFHSDYGPQQTNLANLDEYYGSHSPSGAPTLPGNTAPLAAARRSLVRIDEIGSVRSGGQLGRLEKGSTSSETTLPTADRPNPPLHTLVTAPITPGGTSGIIENDEYANESEQPLLDSNRFSNFRESIRRRSQRKIVLKNALKTGESCQDEKAQDALKRQREMNKLRAQHIDKVARVVFPFTFFLFNVIYWFYYFHDLHHHKQEAPG